MLWPWRPVICTELQCMLEDSFHSKHSIPHCKSIGILGIWAHDKDSLPIIWLHIYNCLWKKYYCLARYDTKQIKWTSNADMASQSRLPLLPKTLRACDITRHIAATRRVYISLHKRPKWLPYGLFCQMRVSFDSRRLWVPYWTERKLSNIQPNSLLQLNISRDWFVLPIHILLQLQAHPIIFKIRLNRPPIDKVMDTDREQD